MRVRITTDIDTPVGVDRIRDALLDFSDKRLETWSKSLDPATYQVHEIGEAWAEVTEGSKRPFVWSRERYEWSERRITWTTLESNFCKPGSHIAMTLAPAEEGGTHLTVTWDRTAANWRGRLVLFPIKLGGRRLLGWATRMALQSIDASD